MGLQDLCWIRTLAGSGAQQERVRKAKALRAAALTLAVQQEWLHKCIHDEALRLDKVTTALPHRSYYGSSSSSSSSSKSLSPSASSSSSPSSASSSGLPQSFALLFERR
mmetsp:Transcript_23354/g.48955  ORF Transcript_23354/g.48955 Transcript_23354/m.48955 type:complete len:109 (+) Transcript_23354:263-589(+)